MHECAELINSILIARMALLSGCAATKSFPPAHNEIEQKSPHIRVVVAHRSECLILQPQAHVRLPRHERKLFERGAGTGRLWNRLPARENIVNTADDNICQSVYVLSRWEQVKALKLPFM